MVLLKDYVYFVRQVWKHQAVYIHIHRYGDCNTSKYHRTPWAKRRLLPLAEPYNY